MMSLGPITCRRRARGSQVFCFWLWALLLSIHTVLVADTLPVLRTAEQIRRLTPEEAARHYPVRLRGVVTFFNQNLFSRFVQDDTAGIYLGEYPNPIHIPPGQLVEVVGTTSAGEYAPMVSPKTVRVLGPGELPAAKILTFEELATGQEDSQFVEISGIVRTARLEMPSGYVLVEVATGGGRLTAYVPDLPPSHINNLVDCKVRLRGVCSTQFNRQRQLFYIRVLVPKAEDFIVEKQAPAEPFTITSQSIASLLQFTPRGTYGHRVKVGGTVIYHQPGEALFIQDNMHGLRVQSLESTPLHMGDEVEVLGFPSQGIYTPTLQDAIFRKLHGGPGPEPAHVSLNELLKGDYDSRLVRIEAVLLDRVRYGREQFLVLEADNFVFHAYADQEQPAFFSNLEAGSRVAVTGVCVIEPGTDWRAGEAWRAKSFRLLLRSPADVAFLKAPAWWTLRRLLWLITLLAVLALGTLAWVGVLRRRVREQTEIIRQKLEVEAALKERYVNLFENANDIVYTHDPQGHITSINQAGERLLQRPRDQILSRSIVDLIVPEQRSHAQQWLQQVLKGANPPVVEWDFTGASGQPLKLEISTRLLQSNGAQPEVEGIARDITERKRLERELLDISNREQRRIGHDLHDGVCQQLVGISYLTETLTDRLQDKGATEAADAERIGYLLNNTLTQTRGVARGLFPVRLEENGLASALEELAANSCALFQITCVFHANNPPEGIDNAIALHLYYIAQEAIANAAKHGHATEVQVCLEPDKDQFALSVRDNGSGFSEGVSQHSGMGLRIMHYRSRVIGATLDVNSAPGQGTSIRCLFRTAFPEADK